VEPLHLMPVCPMQRECQCRSARASGATHSASTEMLRHPESSLLDKMSCPREWLQEGLGCG
jgi:hypothetical protein